jgi:hypothetical protein
MVASIDIIMSAQAMMMKTGTRRIGCGSVVDVFVGVGTGLRFGILATARAMGRRRSGFRRQDYCTRPCAALHRVGARARSQS